MQYFAYNYMKKVVLKKALEINLAKSKFFFEAKTCTNHIMLSHLNKKKFYQSDALVYFVPLIQKK